MAAAKAGASMPTTRAPQFLRQKVMSEADAAKADARRSVGGREPRWRPASGTPASGVRPDWPILDADSVDGLRKAAGRPGATP